MKVFISWSGDLSKAVAEALRAWLKLVIQATEPFVSTEDVDKGSIWFNEISDHLANTGAGIICLTQDNMNSPWILFEAGALSKGLSKNRVFTFLADTSFSSLKPPLSQFNGTCLEEGDVVKMLVSINRALGDRALDGVILKKAFDAHWPSLKSELETAREAHQPKNAKLSKRSSEEMLGEILEITRSLQSYAQSQGTLTRAARNPLKLSDALTVRAIKDIYPWLVLNPLDAKFEASQIEAALTAVEEDQRYRDEQRTLSATQSGI